MYKRSVLCQLSFFFMFMVGALQAEEVACPSCHSIGELPWYHQECRGCHGGGHDGQMAARSRRTEACTGCHAREKESFVASKHGVIATLESERMDFSRPLREGNIRSPTCSYCHFHNGQHQITLPSTEAAVRIAVRSTPCQDCHSPRFVKTWFISGERMIELGRMKQREIEAIGNEIVKMNSDRKQEVDIILKQMNEHMYNLSLGVGHAFPEAQWWQGHASLDGDLLRIKSLLSEILGTTTLNRGRLFFDFML
ncbi:MAG: hypothetical protein H7832_05935 [Magnetococcus sp. DMHC-6]